MCVCVCVCLLSRISPLGLVFVVKTLLCTQRGQTFCGVFSETPLLQRSLAPSHDGGSAIFPTENARAHCALQQGQFTM